MLCAIAAVLGAALLLLAPPPAGAVGQAASGETLFYPCTSCHPVGPQGTATGLPNDFPGHQVVLIGHDALGEGSAACLVCHDDPARDPGKLVLLDGSLVDITGDVPALCFTCHSERYREWAAGTHGRNQPSCTSSGCHDPHTPAWVYGDPLLPFVGTGFQVRSVSDRQAFTPLAGPPVKAPVVTPSWLVLATLLVAFLATGIVGYLVRGRSAR